MRMTLIPAVNTVCRLMANRAVGLLRQGTGLNTCEGLVKRDLLNGEPREFEMQQWGEHVGTSIEEGCLIISSSSLFTKVVGEPREMERKLGGHNR